MTEALTQAQPLTAEMMDVASHRVHNFESFGRAVADHVMRVARSQEIDGTAVKVPAEFTVRSSTVGDRGPVLRSGCVDVCLGVPGFELCVHVQWE